MDETKLSDIGWEQVTFRVWCRVSAMLLHNSKLLIFSALFRAGVHTAIVSRQVHIVGARGHADEILTLGGLEFAWIQDC